LAKSAARFKLMKAVRQTIQNTLEIIGVTAPEKM
ncbi:DALR anticodon-binding domain-containing protein, partial [Staphylococcus sp. SIMBA_130]